MAYSIAYHPNYCHSVPSGHRFPMEKYELLPQQLIYRGICSPEQFFEPGIAELGPIKAVHDPQYIDDLINLKLDRAAVRRIGFEHTEALVHRELTLVQGTIESALHAMEDDIGFNIAGGTHHACHAHGEGFCMINDQAVAAQFLLEVQPQVHKILIIDLDVHQGNGTADLLGGHKDIFTFSMHGEKNYPFRKAISHWDIGLEDGIETNEYLELLATALPQLLERAQPDFLFYQAGVDILATDKMGKLKVSLEGCKQRDQMVLAWAKQHNIPVQCCMGGGYSTNITDILEAHTQTFIVANDIFGA